MSRFRRRLMGLAAMRKALADDYVRVEYIENTSHTAYIDTKIIANQNINYEIKVQFTKNTSYPYIFGAQQAGRNRRFSLMEGSWKAFYYAANLHMQEINLSLTEEQQTSNLVVKKDGLIMYVDGEQKGTFSNTTFTTPSTLTIFTCHYANGNIDTGHQFFGKLYYFKIYDGTTLIRDYIPMYQISTDTYGLWDRVEKKFYTSPNGVKFTGGREVIDEDYVLMDYIENPSTAYLNTGVNFYLLSPSKYININLDVLEAKSQWSTVYGARYNSNDVDSIIIQTSNNNKWYSRQAGPGFYLSLPIVGKHNFKLVDGHNYVDNVSFSDKYPIPRYSGAYMCLLATNNLQTNTVTDLGLHCKIFDCQIGNGNELVRDYVPVRQISSGKYGLYDKINGNFISSANSVEFTSVE